MKKLIIYIFLISSTINFLKSQDRVSSILEEIEKNNTNLMALRQQAEAGKLSSRTGIYLSNPEVDFNYLWGSPVDIGNRTDFSVTQSFDFPTAYKYKKNKARLMENQFDLVYQAERVNILHEARLICIDMVYYNTLIMENQQRLKYAESIAEAVSKMYEQGKANILDQNKAQFNLANTVSDNTLLEAELNELKTELLRYNGGMEIDHELLNIFPPLIMPDNFDEWYAGLEMNNPILQYYIEQAEIGKNEEKLSRALSLPKFSAGYMSEKVVGEKYQGVSVGMSIPLWENKTTVKAAKAQTAANIAMANDSRVQLYAQLKSQYNKALDLIKAHDGYGASLTDVNNTDLLKRAFDLGEISLIEYLIEVQFYYDTLVKALQTERDMHKAFAELEKWN